MGWTKRKSITFTCPSGNVVQIRRPGPSLALKCTRSIRIFERGGPDVLTDIAAQIKFIESLPDAELEQIYSDARIVLIDVITEPRLYLNPTDDQLSPDDIPIEDFWLIFGCVSRGIREMSVETKDGETTVAAVENFPSEPAGSSEPVSDSPTVQ